ncbi:MAG: hypothetical protein MJY85_01705 [Fibrobacter sp.]|nr:hypothetical protein [Fibrobacter sp.]
MKKFAALLGVLASLSFGSMIGIDALGEEQVMGGTASAAGRGFSGNAKTGDSEGLSVVNPARLAFDKNVVFNLNFALEMDAASKSGHHMLTNGMSIPSFNISFPMGDFGAMGVSLWQHYSSNLNEKASGSDAAKIEYQGSVYELVPTYAIRIPYLRSVSLGAAAHVVLGNISRSLTLGPDNSAVTEEDEWGTRHTKVSDFVDGTWEIKNHPAYYAAALQYRGRQVSYFFSYTTGYTLKNDLDYDFRYSEIDTLVPTSYSREIKVPAMFATGISYRLFKRHNIMLDLQWRAWDEDIENIAGSWTMPNYTETQSDFMASVGYQLDGVPLFYEDYWKRINYRVGAWYKNWYVKDVYEVGGSVGAGFPMGRKGTTVDLALQGGKRFSDAKTEWEESFFAIRIGLTGIGTWGQSRR